MSDRVHWSKTSTQNRPRSMPSDFALIPRWIGEAKRGYKKAKSDRRYSIVLPPMATGHGAGMAHVRMTPMESWGYDVGASPA